MSTPESVYMPVLQDPVFAPYQHLIDAEQELVPNISVDGTLRIKVLDKCGMTCNFCHNEGTPVASDVGFQALRVSIYAATNGIGFQQADMTAADAPVFGRILEDVRTAGLGDEVHWTGGEPTLAKSLPDLTYAARDAGYDVKMTSNGQSGERGLAALTEAGLQGVNFSIFGTTPAELAATQGPVFRDNLKLAANRLARMDEAMVAACSLGLRVKANVVISGEQDIDRGLRLLGNAPAGVKVRFQADTTNRQPSLAAIYKLLTELDATPERRDIVAGCSIDNYDYALPDGRSVTFKQTRYSRLPETCQDCTVDASGDCHEGYYGLRLYKDTGGTYWVSACIQRMDIAQPVDTFLGPDGAGAEVRRYRQQDYTSLLSPTTTTPSKE